MGELIRPRGSKAVPKKAQPWMKSSKMDPAAFRSTLPKGNEISTLRKPDQAGCHWSTRAAEHKQDGAFVGCLTLEA